MNNKAYSATLLTFIINCFFMCPVTAGGDNDLALLALFRDRTITTNTQRETALASIATTPDDWRKALKFAVPLDPTCTPELSLTVQTILDHLRPEQATPSACADKSPRYRIDTTVAHRENDEHTTLINMTQSPEVLQILLDKLQPTTEKFSDLINTALKRNKTAHARILLNYSCLRPHGLLSPHEAERLVTLSTHKKSIKEILEAAVKEDEPDHLLVTFIASLVRPEEIHDALTIASRKEDCDLVKNLLEMAKPLETPTMIMPMKALSIAIETNNSDMLQLFLDHGVDPHSLLPNTQESLLAFAVRMNADKAIMLLEPFYSEEDRTAILDAAYTSFLKDAQEEQSSRKNMRSQKRSFPFYTKSDVDVTQDKLNETVQDQSSEIFVHDENSSGGQENKPTPQTVHEPKPQYQKSFDSEASFEEPSFKHRSTAGPSEPEKTNFTLPQTAHSFTATQAAENTSYTAWGLGVATASTVAAGAIVTTFIQWLYKKIKQRLPKEKSSENIPK